MGCDRYKTRPDSQRRFAGHTRGARHADAAADDEHASLSALMSRATPARQRRGDRVLVNAPGCRLNECKRAGRHAKTIEEYVASVIGSDAQVEPQLESDEGHRSVGDNRCAERVPGIGVQAARNIKGEHRRRARVDSADPIRHRAVDGSRQPRPEDGVSNHIRALQKLFIP